MRWTLAGRRHLKCPEGKICDLDLNCTGSIWRRASVAGEVPGTLRQSRAVPGRGGGVRRLAALGAPAAGSRPPGPADGRRWTAVQQPGVKTVAIKSEEQQAILALHRMRQQLVKFRTAQINGLRGLLAEYGEVMPQGRAGIVRGIAAALERVSERLPAMVVETLREQWARVIRLDEEIGEMERRLALWHKNNAASRRIAAIPGVGVLSATAAVAAMGDPGAFKSGREFAAWLGLVPPAHRHRRAGAHARHLQAWGQLSAHLADPRRPLGAHQRQSAAGLGVAPGRASAGERRHGSTRQQDGTHDLGLAGP